MINQKVVKNKITAKEADTNLETVNFVVYQESSTAVNAIGFVELSKRSNFANREQAFANNERVNLSICFKRANKVIHFVMDKRMVLV